SLNFVLPYLSRVPNSLIRAELIADIAQKMDVNAGIVKDAFQKAAMTQRESIQAPAAAGARIPSAEGMLVRLLLEDEQARQRIPVLLERTDLVEEMECAPIVAGLLGMISAGENPDLTALSDRLGQPEQRLLAELAFNKEARPV